MRFIGDFHLHSSLSRATSKNLTPEFLDLWSRIKGITVVGTGDATHPEWTRELKEKLDPAESGLYRLKPELQIKNSSSPAGNVRFLLTTELSTIYKKNDRVRKVHHVIFLPNIEVAESLQRELKRRKFNIMSDGRPILGLDSRDLLDLCLNVSNEIFFVPAHIWTPWFSALGAKSGFDSIEECYGDLAHHISAIETGLSSDAPMNWLCSRLDRFTLISNSDAHSPEKLGRNANIFDTTLSYEGMIEAMKTGNSKKFLGTIDLFPQEGKYHFAGHRKCGVVLDPVECLKHENFCPKCGKPLTSGVMNRVLELADRTNLEERPNRLPFHSTIPLKEILGEILGTSENSKKVEALYFSLIQKLGPELEILLSSPIERIQKENEMLAEGIRRMRNREISIHEGYDGEYGKIRVFETGETKKFSPQNSLFSSGERRVAKKRGMLDFDLEEFRAWREAHNFDRKHSASSQSSGNISASELNSEQTLAAKHFEGPALVLAGPGTGKTRVLTERIARLVKEKNIAPDKIIAVTFTRRAAEEMRERLQKLGFVRRGETNPTFPTIGTFHALGLSILKENLKATGRTEGFSIIDEHEQKKLREEWGNGYENFLQEQNLFDLDQLISEPVRLFAHPEIAKKYREKFQFVLIDEFQDINAAQYDLIRKLCPEAGANIFAIGDPNQAIYGFRGANVGFLQKFQSDFPKTKIFSLSQSYRCSQNILSASANVLDEKPLLGLQEGVKVKLVKNRSDLSEAESIAREIQKMLGGTSFFAIDSGVSEGMGHDEISSLSDFAVLCRTKSLMEKFEKSFSDHCVPFQRITEIPFFQQEPVRSVIERLKLAQNPDNNFLKKRSRLTASECEELQKLTKNQSVKNALARIAERFFKNPKKDFSAELKMLLELAENFGEDRTGFLEFTELGKGPDTFKSRSESVALMTLYASKGLEFSCVFIPACENKILPYSLAERISDIEEEKRLLYVGMTRAKKFLFLSHAEKRFLHGQELKLERSPFLDTIEEELLEHEEDRFVPREKMKEEKQASLF